MKQKKQLVMLALFVLCMDIQAQTNSNLLPDWALGAFVRPADEGPMIEPTDQTAFFCPHKQQNVKWECADTFNPAAIVRNDTIYVLYRAEDDPSAGIGGRCSRIGLVGSLDGVHVDYRSPVPVMYPDGSDVAKTYEWNGGCEDPRVTETEDGTYVMAFTSWNHSVPRLSIATSKDLRSWTHHGPAFLTAHGGKFKNLACKSGSIVTEVKDGHLIMKRINGKYLMYWGEEYVAAATSDDGISWEPLIDDKGNLVHLIEPRSGHFDSQLTECGPPAVATDQGIVLIYNGKNHGDNGKMDPHYPANTYAAGQVLFSNENPYKVIGRLDNAFFRPMVSYEKSGQYAAGTVFAEGLAYKEGRWYLYYGCADSMVGVAICDLADDNREGDPMVLPVPEGIINAFPAGGNGKLRCTIHSYSGCTNSDESPFYLNYSYVDGRKKWCDISTDHPWVIFELTDYYQLNRFTWRDVSPYEKGNGNVPEYWIYTSSTGTDDADWELQVHRENQGGVAVKDDVLNQPVEARYVKFVTTRGTRTDNGQPENAIRIYGFDIYGDYSRATEKDGIVSIGKTVLTQTDCTNERETALNLLDGNHSDKQTKWCFYKGDVAESPQKYVVIDLEDIYDLSQFVIYDCQNIEPDENLDAYQISVATELPDLSLIGPEGDDNSCWQTIVDRTNTGSEATHTDHLDTPVKGRYVKLAIPRTTASMNNHTSRIYSFDVYGTLSATAINHPLVDNPSSREKSGEVSPTSKRYNLNGIAATSHHGIVICNGKKMVIAR